MIKTERLILAPFDMKYLQDYYNGFNEEITKYQWPDPFANIDDAKNMLQDFLTEMEQGETLLFSILQNNGKFLGSVEIHGLTGECPELGIWITSTEQNKGYAYEALCAALIYASSKYGKQTISPAGHDSPYYPGEPEKDVSSLPAGTEPITISPCVL